jgi:hypothetical protein
VSKLEELVREACALPAEQRLTLVRRVLASGEPDADAEMERAWDAAIRERIARSDRSDTSRTAL